VYAFLGDLARLHGLVPVGRAMRPCDEKERQSVDLALRIHLAP
jgi:hypothetical protein